ncbi:MAG: hypothetical protein FWH17_02450 [Oscillospiraceae bacterium]|nr:hypothetical protein [Oscillospiraceae bacterium]
MKKKYVFILIALMLVIAAAMPVIFAWASQDEPGDGETPTAGETPPAEPTPPPPPEPTPPPPPTPRPFPQWFNKLTVLPNWIFDVDELPDWFYDLTEMPGWFYEIPRVPLWFYQITEIPDWFYPPTPPPPEQTKDGESYANGDWFWPENPDPPIVTPPPGLDPQDTPPPENGEDPTDTEPEYPFDIAEYPFVYELPDNLGVLGSTVPFGMITDGGVRLEYPAYLLVMTRRGDVFNYEPGNLIAESGTYILSTTSGEEVFRFRIITDPVNDLDEYTAPSGFHISTVSFGDSGETLINNVSHPTTQDGTYYFSLIDSYTDEILAVVRVTVDTLAPTLIFDGWEEGEERADAPVSFSPSESDADITVTLGGNPYLPDDNTLTTPGNYVIVVSDLAGNATIYSFRLTGAGGGGGCINAAGVWLIILMVLMLGALIFFLMRNRRKARVR